MFKSNNQTSASGGTVSGIVFTVKTVVIAYILSFVLLFLLSIVATYRAFSPMAISISANTVTALATLFAGFLAGRHFSGKGIVFGAICGTLYTLLLLLAGCIASKSFAPGQEGLIALAIGIICGGTGGIVGINTKRPVRR